MRKYILASSTLGTWFDQAMEDAIRANKFRQLELSAGLLYYEENKERSDETIRRIQNMVKDGALVIGSVHIPFGTPFDPSAIDENDRLRNCENIRMIVRKCVDAGLGAPHYTLHGGMEPTLDADRPHRLAQSHKSLSELAPFFAELGACVNVELLPRSCCGNTVEELQIITDGQPENVGVCLDVNHVMNRAAHLPEYIRALAPRIKSFHLSDYDNVDEQHWYIPHAGVINWHAVMPAIREIDHDVNMIFEARFLQGCTWRGNTKMDSAVRLYEYAAYYLENIEKFAATDAEFETFSVPGN